MDACPLLLFFLFGIMKLLLTVTTALGLVSTPVFGQSFTEKLKQKTAGQGSVVIFQDATIDNLVNGKARNGAVVPSKNVTTPASGSKTTPAEGNRLAENDTTATGLTKTSRKSVFITGYRIQLYAGSDSRTSRQKAYNIGNQFKAKFPTLPVYTHFYSPRWTCRAGDFRTYEEASNYLHQLQQMGGFNEAAIIKCKIQVSY